MPRARDGRPSRRCDAVLRVLEDQRVRAADALPEGVAYYYASGSGDEETLGEAEAAWRSFRLRPRPLRDVSTVDLSTRLLGASLASPLGVAPSAFHRLAHPDAEAATARATGDAGGLFVLSTRSSLPLEDVAAAATGPWWFQVYVMRDRDLTARVVERAAAAGAGALVLTGDTPYVGIKKGLQGTRIDLPEDHFLVNLRQHLAPGADSAHAASQDPSITLETIAWLREVSGLPVLVKGVLRGDSAVECLDAGAAGVLVSTHGGRQLDRAVPSALALAEVVDAVDGRGLVLVDGGIRSGVDVLTALALGADAALLGRPALWALAAGGQDGVRRCLEAVRDDLAHAAALAGCARLSDVDRTLVAPAPNQHHRLS